MDSLASTNMVSRPLSPVRPPVPAEYLRVAVNQICLTPAQGKFRIRPVRACERAIPKMRQAS